MKTTLRIIAGMCLGLLAVNALSEDEATIRGEEIAAEADRRASGFVDSEESFTMTLVDKRGNERVRTLRLKTMERSDDGDWGLTIFDEPRDVKGTAFLSIAMDWNPMTSGFIYPH